MALHSKWSSGDLIFYDGTQDIFTVKNSTGGIIVGEDGLGIDFTFYGATTGAYMKWDESEDEFDITATVEMQTTNKIQFGTAGSYIHASTGSQLDIVTTGTLYLNGEVTYPDPTTTNSTGAVTLTATSNRVQFVDSCGQSITYTLPAIADCAGIEFKFVNFSSGGVITVNDTGASAVAEITSSGVGYLLCDGTNWGALTGGSTF